MKTESYKTEFKRMLAKSGLKIFWIAAQLGMDRTTLSRKVDNDTLTPEQKEEIKTLLTK